MFIVDNMFSLNLNKNIDDHFRNYDHIIDSLIFNMLNCTFYQVILFIFVGTGDVVLSTYFIFKVISLKILILYMMPVSMRSTHNKQGIIIVFKYRRDTLNTCFLSFIIGKQLIKRKFALQDNSSISDTWIIGFCLFYLSWVVWKKNIFLSNIFLS